jgi:hypothetical protein
MHIRNAEPVDVWIDENQVVQKLSKMKTEYQEDEDCRSSLIKKLTNVCETDSDGQGLVYLSSEEMNLLMNL